MLEELGEVPVLFTLTFFLKVGASDMAFKMRLPAGILVFSSVSILGMVSAVPTFLLYSSGTCGGAWASELLRCPL